MRANFSFLDQILNALLSLVTVFFILVLAVLIVLLFRILTTEDATHGPSPLALGAETRLLLNLDLLLIATVTKLSHHFLLLRPIHLHYCLLRADWLIIVRLLPYGLEASPQTAGEVGFTRLTQTGSLYLAFLGLRFLGWEGH